MYDLPGRTDVAKVVLDADAVRRISAPTRIARAVRPSRQRRAAS
jgi:ATP-dependent protease Clp ATPase subunit